MSSGIIEVHMLPGELLFREGEQSFHFYILHEGNVEIFRDVTGPQGTKEKVSLAVIGPGQAVGEFAMIDRSVRSASAMAITAVNASMISEAAYQQLLSDLPDWATVVMTSMVSRIRTLNKTAKPQV